MRHPDSLFVTLEGIEGAGKTTVAGELTEKLKSAGREVLYIREPGGTGLGEEIRHLLLHTAEDIAPPAELMLFLASRAQLVSHAIAPALASGAVVICDRFADSSVAYQGYGRDIDIEAVNTLNRVVCGDIWPDVTLLLDLPVKSGLGRQQMLDRISQQEADFYNRVRAGYLAIARQDPQRVKTIDAARPLDEVLDAVWKVLPQL